MGKQARKEQEREHKRRLILDAAKGLFIRQGFDNVSMRGIAAAAGYSPAAIYRYFPGKRAILSHLRNEGFREFHAGQLAQEGAQKPEEMLRRAGRNYLRFAMENPDDFHLMFCTSCEEVDLEGELAEESMQSYHHFRNRMAQVVRSGYFGDVDEEAVVFGLWSGVHGLASLAVSGRLGVFSDSDLDTLLEKTLRFLRRPGTTCDCKQEDKS
ncbi:TetR/AcrR family transcriptional regulator [Pseudodesulfovibrio senegalensis]|jgi:AcrR family transcriptional regulator|uniref:TetR/AcrR family transcriptional regulator n=1 Tax=Pseudodesulfovibrio senegalensis TaxID=1721087 RepID=A0A6N6N0S3_9BACT|nr:TetR/AcrR family transcriptional regulator [Pseudodesulfovibrio senegalensis]KAB1440866.1 TetR/AcrR family transcriptional regulator [Pseudodesulfovibrio senegalensis]